MQCSRCGADNAAGSAACTQCGTSLVPPPPPAGSQPGWSPPPPPPPGGQAGYPPPPGQQWAPPPPGGYQGWTPPGYGGGYGTQVPNYLVQSILVTLLCCLPFGIVAIVYSAQANGKAGSGDYSGAMAAARSAKTWCWAAVGTGLAVSTLWILVVMAGSIGGSGY